MKFNVPHLISGIFILAIFLLAAQPATACMCPVQEPLQKESVKRAKADAQVVFMGEVISIDTVQLKDTGVDHVLPDGSIEFILPQYRRWVVFRVTDVWKGDVVSEIRLIVNGNNCDFPFEEGKSYLVYAYGKALTTNMCRRTASIDAKNTRKEIKILNKLKE